MISPVMIFATETDWAWLAGAIDGEGSLGFYTHYSDYQIALRVFNTNREFIEKASILMDSNITPTSSIISTKPCWCAGVYQYDKILFILEKVLPYLTAKKWIAELIITYLKVHKG